MYNRGYLSAFGWNIVGKLEGSRHVELSITDFKMKAAIEFEFVPFKRKFLTASIHMK
jgi:hypothetical protein